jgi:hypothetical protein
MNQLTVQDLAITVNLIDACVERGAFKGNEIYNVGQLREKIASVVLAAQKQTEEEQADAEATETFVPAGE